MLHNSFNCLFSGIAPDRVLAAVVEADRFIGDETKNTFVWGGHNVRSIKLALDTQSEHRDYIRVDIENGFYHEGLLSVLKGFSFFRTGRTCLLTPERYTKGNVLYCFDLSPGQVGNTQDTFQTLQRGNLRLQMEFGSATAKNLIVYFLMFFRSEIIVTADRQILYDYNT